MKVAHPFTEAQSKNWYVLSRYGGQSYESLHKSPKPGGSDPNSRAFLMGLQTSPSDRLCRWKPHTILLLAATEKGGLLTSYRVLWIINTGMFTFRARAPTMSVGEGPIETVIRALMKSEPRTY